MLRLILFALISAAIALPAFAQEKDDIASGQNFNQTRFKDFEWQVSIAAAKLEVSQPQISLDDGLSEDSLQVVQVDLEPLAAEAEWTVTVTKAFLYIHSPRDYAIAAYKAACTAKENRAGLSKEEKEDAVEGCMFHNMQIENYMIYLKASASPRESRWFAGMDAEEVEAVLAARYGSRPEKKPQ